MLKSCVCLYHIDTYILWLAIYIIALKSHHTGQSLYIVNVIIAVIWRLMWVSSFKRNGIYIHLSGDVSAQRQIKLKVIDEAMIKLSSLAWELVTRTGWWVTDRFLILCQRCWLQVGVSWGIDSNAPHYVFHLSNMVLLIRRQLWLWEDRSGSPFVNFRLPSASNIPQTGLKVGIYTMYIHYIVYSECICWSVYMVCMCMLPKKAPKSIHVFLYCSLHACKWCIYNVMHAWRASKESRALSINYAPRMRI